MGQLIEGELIVPIAVTDHMSGPLHRRMQIANRDIRRTQEAAPGIEEPIWEARIEQAQSIARSGDLAKKIFCPSDIAFREAAAEFSSGIGLEQDALFRRGGGFFDHASFENADPHLEIRGLLEQQVLLCGKQPEQIASPYLEAPVAKKVSSMPASYKIKLEFGVMMPLVQRAQ